MGGTLAGCRLNLWGKCRSSADGSRWPNELRLEFLFWPQHQEREVRSNPGSKVGAEDDDLDTEGDQVNGAVERALGSNVAEERQYQQSPRSGAEIAESRFVDHEEHQPQQRSN